MDPWLAYPEYERFLAASKWRDQEAFNEAYERFLRAILPYAGRVFILRAFSADAAWVVPDKSLDFVFIDGNHFYPYVSKDIDLWTRKVRFGGLVAGHDYLAHPKTGEKWGVVEAVDERFGDRVHTEPHYVWWVEKW